MATKKALKNGSLDIKFYPSQIPTSINPPHPYTASPSVLLLQDIASFFHLCRFLPFIIVPTSPCSSRELCELYPSVANLWAIFLHCLLIVWQAAFLVGILVWLWLPVWMIVVEVCIFWGVNKMICRVLNGGAVECRSDEAYCEKKEELQHEQWLFLNGVSVG